jgi:hypothetical protein
MADIGPYTGLFQCSSSAVPICTVILKVTGFKEVFPSIFLRSCFHLYEVLIQFIIDESIMIIIQFILIIYLFTYLFTAQRPILE